MKRSVNGYGRLLGAALIVLVCAAVYARSLQNGFIWDDDFLVYRNPCVTAGWGGLAAIWFSYQTIQYYPAVFTTFWIEYRLWGADPLGYHVVNALLHIVNALLVYALAGRLYKRAALPVALLFAVHPMQVETVAWISERKNLLALCFLLLTIRSYFDYDARPSSRAYVRTLGLFALALLSKSIALCFVAVPCLYAWSQNGRITAREVKRTLPFFALGLAAGLNTLLLEMYAVGAQGGGWGLGLADRMVLWGRVMLFYLTQTVLPAGCVFFYPRWQIDAGQPAQWLPLLGMIGVGIVLLAAARRGRNGLLLLYLFWVIALLPASGLFNVYPMQYSYVADHFSYLASPVLLLLLLAPYTLFKRGRPFIVAAFCIYLFWCGYESYGLTQNYQNETTLWQSVIRKNPGCWAAYNNLGNIYDRGGEHSRAAALYRQALAVKPDYADAWYNLGETLTDMGDIAGAMAAYERTVSSDPQYAVAYYNLGVLLDRQGNSTLAAERYWQAVSLRPDFAAARINLGQALMREGHAERAIEQYRAVVALGTALPEAYYNLGNACAQLGNYDRAISAYQDALRVKPAFAEAAFALGSVFKRLGNVDAAIAAYRQALRYKPDLGEAWYNLGNAYAGQGLQRPAIAAYEQALRCLPDDARIHANLAAALFYAQEFGRARAFCKSAAALGFELPPRLAEQINTAAKQQQQ